MGRHHGVSPRFRQEIIMAETTMEAVPIPTEEPKREKKKRKFSFP